MLDRIVLPGAMMVVTLGLGSGLSRRPGDAAGRVWAIADRGPNMKPSLAVERYGLHRLAPLAAVKGAKIMPQARIGPTLCELAVHGDHVHLVRAMRLRTTVREISGLPLPGGPEATMEPIFGLDGAPLGADPDGADTEAVAALPDGSFWVAEEYGPSLMKVDPAGVVQARWTPVGQSIEGSSCPVAPALPQIANRRRLNRGFEAIAASPDGRTLFVAFQSALTGPGEPADVVRIWTLEAQSGAVLAEHFYRFDAPTTFRRDHAAEAIDQRDLKICDLEWAGPDRLLVLERVTRSSKVYAVRLDGGVCAKPSESAEQAQCVDKTLVFSTDETPEIVADLEGMTLLSDREMLLVNDNDFGIEGASTRFFRVTFDAAI